MRRLLPVSTMLLAMMVSWTTEVRADGNPVPANLHATSVILPDGLAALLNTITHESVALRTRIDEENEFTGLEVVGSASILGLGVEAGIRYDRSLVREKSSDALSLVYGLQLHPMAWFSRRANRWVDPHLRAGVLAGVHYRDGEVGSGTGTYSAVGLDLRLFSLGGSASPPGGSAMAAEQLKNRTGVYLTTNYEYVWNRITDDSQAGAEFTLGLSLGKRW